MELTGKCKEDFEKWLFSSINNWVIDEITHQEYYGENMFYQLPESMQYGVYVDFFDSVGMYVETYYAGLAVYEVIVNEQGYNLCITRQKARTAAIKKACEIYNNIN